MKTGLNISSSRGDRAANSSRGLAEVTHSLVMIICPAVSLFSGFFVF